MSNGKQMGDDYYLKFLEWAAGKTDQEFKLLERRGILNRSEICKELVFSRSVFTSNPHINAALQKLEEGLRERGVLPAEEEKEPFDKNTAPVREVGARNAGVDAERMRRLELDNAALRQELTEIKRQLQKYSTLAEALSMTGRVPR